MSKSRDIADSAATINFIDTVTSNVQTQLNTLDTAIDNISVTSGTLTKTFAQNESASINLTSSVLAPVVSVTKEVPQSGVTNNNWDVNSTTENYTRLDSAAATTLSFVGYGISTASFVGSFSVSGQDTSQQDIAFNSDGTKMFVVGRGNDSVYEYTLSTAFDILTASYVQSFSVTSQEIQPQGLAFNTDGTKMFVVGGSGDDVNEYTLSTGFNISTATFVDSFSVSAQSISPQSVRFNSDGTIMFVLGNSADSVFQYTLSTAFDVSTASYSSISFSVASQEANPRGLSFSPDGTKMFVVGDIGDSVNEYTLSTAFNVSTASYSQNFSVATQDSGPTGIAFNLDGTKMFVVGEGNNSVYEYTLPLSLTLGTGSFASADVGKTIEANSGAFVLTATDGSYVQTTAPTSYAQVASGSWSMYGVVYNTTDGDLQLSGATINQFDISTAVYQQNFSIAAQDTAPQGLAFNTDGTKMFVVGGVNDAINEYTLSIGFDVSSSTFVDSFSVSAQDSQPVDLHFSPDGTKMYFVGAVNDAVYEYTLSTAFDISSASFVRQNAIGAQETAPNGLTFSPDGTKMFVCGSQGQDVNEYTLSTAFNISTASFVDAFSVSAQDTNPKGLSFNSDGTQLFVVGATDQDINKYSLTAYDVSTASFVSSFSVATQETAPVGIAFNPDGTKMFVVGYTGDDVNQYSVGTTSIPSGYQPVHTTNSIDSTYWTDINSMTADQNAGSGNIYYAISTDDRTTWSVIDNTDGERDIVRSNAGTWQYNSNATYASQTWVNGTTNTELATLAEAMTGASSTVGYQLSSASFDSVTFSFASQNTAPRGFAFNSDGTKMYQAAYSGTIYQYTLSTGYDLSTASYSTSASFTAQSTSINNFAFSSDGAKLYIISYADKTVYQYSLSTVYDVTTASYDSLSFGVNGQETDPYAIAISSDGTKFFVVGTSGDDVNEYTLSTAYNISTASFVDSFSTQPQEYNPYGIYFNSNGTYMFIVGNDDNVNQYTLQTGFDVSTASHTLTFSVASQELTPNGISFNSDGTKMYVSGYASDNVNQYSTAGTSYTNQMDKTQLDAVTDPNHIALGNDLDLAIVFNMTSGSTVPSSDGVAINYDANVLNKGAVLGTDYDFDAPAQNSARITALTSGNFKVRVV